MFIFKENDAHDLAQKLKAVLNLEVHSNRGLSLKGCVFKDFKPPFSIG